MKKNTSKFKDFEYEQLTKEQQKTIKGGGEDAPVDPSKAGTTGFP